MKEFVETYLPNVSEILPEIWQSTLETIYMTLLTGIIAGIFGIFFGVILVLTDEQGLAPNKVVYEKNSPLYL